MNLQQFSALEVGDEVENTMSHSVGKVTRTEANGVHISWGGNAHSFFYSVMSTAWFHWNRVVREPRPTDQRPQGHL